MNKLKFHIEFCYGIANLDWEIDFSSRKVVLLYASNGVMKTSFAKASENYILSKNEDSQDRRNPSATPVFSIIDPTTNDVFPPDKLHVIRTYKRGYENKPSVAKLLASDSLKTEYSDVIKVVEEKRKDLIRLLRECVGKKSDADVEETVIDALGGIDFGDSIYKVKNSIAEDYRSDLIKIKFTEIFNKDVLTFLGKPNVKSSLKLYREKYHDIIERSRTFGAGFDHHGAETVNTAMRKSKFFQAGHLLQLNGSEKVDSVEQLDEIVRRETSEILQSPEIKDIFKKVDDEIKKNETLLGFKNFIESHPLLIDEFDNLPILKKNLLLSYLSKYQGEVILYCDSLDQASDKVNSIIQRAKDEITDWEEAIEIFEERFDVPFKVDIKNRTDVLYKQGEIPTIYFKDKLTGTEIDRKELEGDNEENSVLSQGELRALYLMNIIFEVHARKKAGTETLYVIDDIADSFDYQNKYAIIEYLDEIANYPDTYLVIMTHNYDFCRSVYSRLGVTRGQVKFAIRDETNHNILISNLEYLNNPFETWIKAINKPSYLIACISFVRNLIQYAWGESHQDYLKLTDLLHYKQGIIDIYTVTELYNLLKLHTNCSPQINDSENILAFIIHEADRIELDESSSTRLDYKIVLSIAVRLLAEKYMINILGGPSILSTLPVANPTRGLYDAFKISFANDPAVSTLHKVMLMTPENIHINSFMFEPLIDLGMKQLIKLYGDIKTLV